MQIIRNFGCTNCLSCLFSAKYKQNWHFKLEKCWNAKFLLHPSPPKSRETHLAICYSRIIQNFQLFSKLWYFLIKGSKPWQHYIVSFSWQLTVLLNKLNIVSFIKIGWNHSILECLNECKISLHRIWLEWAGPGSSCYNVITRLWGQSLRSETRRMDTGHRVTVRGTKQRLHGGVIGDWGRQRWPSVRELDKYLALTGA